VKKILADNIDKLKGALRALGAESAARGPGDGDAREINVATGGDEALPPHEPVVSCIEEARTLKAEALEKIDAALEKERQAYEALKQVLASKDYGNWKKKDVLRAKLKVFLARWHEHYSKKILEENIRSLDLLLTKLRGEPDEDGN
jgi:hypothetical protein